MALTLPYPSLVFVPLDILTADQMNEIVANYEYIANQFPIGASNIDFSTLSGNYSETEQDTNYTWIDGNHIYKKTINTGAISGTGTLNVPHGITGYVDFIEMRGMALDLGEGNYKTLPYVRPDTSYSGVSLSVTATNIEIKRNAGYNFAKSWVTLWYTKTGGL